MSSLTDALAIIDNAIKEFVGRSLVDVTEVTNVLLDARNALALTGDDDDVLVNEILTNSP